MVELPEIAKILQKKGRIAVFAFAGGRYNSLIERTSASDGVVKTATVAVASFNSMTRGGAVR